MMDILNNIAQVTIMIRGGKTAKHGMALSFRNMAWHTA